jgi:predicted flap endonuclease-1-like 5' DNA nuclease
MADNSTPADVQPERRRESSTGVRMALRMRSNPDTPTEEIEVIADYLVEEPRPSARTAALSKPSAPPVVPPKLNGHALATPSIPPLPVSANPPAHSQLELERVTREHCEAVAQVAELEIMLSRRSQELLEADEREAVLVRRFHLQTLRLAELDRQVREQKTLIEQLQSALPKRPPEASELHSIRGIGPKYARALSALGVSTIGSLAALSDDDVNRIEQQLRIRNGRIRRERWVEQAQQQTESRASS